MEQEKLSLSIAGSSALRAEFQRALKEAGDGEFIPRPAMLSKMIRERRQAIKDIRNTNETIKQEIARRAKRYLELNRQGPSYEETLSYSPTPPFLKNLLSFNARDEAIQSLWIEKQLSENGAIFGDKPFNFLLGPELIPADYLDKIEQVALRGFQTLTSCANATDGKSPEKLTPTEQAFENLKMIPNAARVDIVVGIGTGAKIIEINSQWVDAICALEAFQIAYLGQPKRPSPTNLLSEVFRGRNKIAIINLAPAFGSRKGGAETELSILAKKLQGKNQFQAVEVINPQKVRPNYLEQFSGYYLNGEPGMITGDIPDWMEVIIEKVKSRQATMFPAWRPSLDKKPALILASQKSDDFVVTLPFSKERMNLFEANNPVILKGNGFSSNAVAVDGISFQPESEKQLFADLVKEAQKYPDQFVIQPKLESKRQPFRLGYNTSSGQPAILAGSREKINVWIIGGKIAGILISCSENDIISDKDFNIVPTAT